MQPEPKNNPTGAKSIRVKILELVSASSSKITPVGLKNALVQTYGLEKNQIKTLIKDLVANGELTYTYEHGCTFVQKSFNKPVRISRWVVLKPPGYKYRSEPHDVVIQVKPGASFGDGRHPTTRLAIKGIEFALKELKPFVLNRECTVLDIGTGSGVLIMTAVRFGVQKGLGIDIDSCARAEARENVKLNDLQARITISDKAIEDIDPSFSMVLANLRVPTLQKLCARIDAVINPHGIVVLSGIRCHELAGLMAVYTAAHFEYVWTAAEFDWAGVVFKKG
jgi:ribosomal protein L11 methyltransferase